MNESDPKVLRARIDDLERQLDELHRAQERRERQFEATRFREEAARTLLDTSPAKAMLIAAGGRIEMINRIAAEAFHHTQDDLLGLSLYDLVDEARTRYNVLEEAIKLGRQLRYEDEQEGRTYDNRLIPTLGEDGGGRVAIHSQNITELKWAEDRVKQTLNQLEETLAGTVEAMARMVEMRDPYTAGHQKRVANIAANLAQRMSLEPGWVDTIWLAGTIHDIGKNAIPAALLSKPAYLTDIETDIVREHARRGYEIIKEIKFPWPIADIVLQHHERLDGSGYPDGLAGEEIQIESRILAVADVVEAMTAHRPHRAAMTRDQVVDELNQHKGKLYDPEVVDAFIGLDITDELSGEIDTLTRELTRWPSFDPDGESGEYSAFRTTGSEEDER